MGKIIFRSMICKVFERCTVRVLILTTNVGALHTFVLEIKTSYSGSPNLEEGQRLS